METHESTITPETTAKKPLLTRLREGGMTAVKGTRNLAKTALSGMKDLLSKKTVGADVAESRIETPAMSRRTMLKGLGIGAGALALAGLSKPARADGYEEEGRVHRDLSAPAPEAAEMSIEKKLELLKDSVCYMRQHFLNMSFLYSTRVLRQDTVVDAALRQGIQHPEEMKYEEYVNGDGQRFIRVTGTGLSMTFRDGRMVNVNGIKIDPRSSSDEMTYEQKIFEADTKFLEAGPLGIKVLTPVEINFFNKHGLDFMARLNELQTLGRSLVPGRDDVSNGEINGFRALYAQEPRSAAEVVSRNRPLSLFLMANPNRYPGVKVVMQIRKGPPRRLPNGKMGQEWILRPVMAINPEGLPMDYNPTTRRHTLDPRFDQSFERTYRPLLEARAKKK